MHGYRWCGDIAVVLQYRLVRGWGWSAVVATDVGITVIVVVTTATTSSSQARDHSTCEQAAHIGGAGRGPAPFKTEDLP